MKSTETVAREVLARLMGSGPYCRKASDYPIHREEQGIAEHMASYLSALLDGPRDERFEREVVRMARTAESLLGVEGVYYAAGVLDGPGYYFDHGGSANGPFRTQEGAAKARVRMLA